MDLVTSPIFQQDSSASQLDASKVRVNTCPWLHRLPLQFFVLWSDTSPFQTSLHHKIKLGSTIPWFLMFIFKNAPVCLK